jgi:tetratricopeptide (TPR) repeat protein
VKSRQSLILTILFLLLLSGLLITAFASDSEPQQLINRGKEEIYHFRLDSALAIFRQLQNEFPELPHGYFYESYITAIYYSQDRTNTALDSLLQRTVRLAVEKGESFRKNGGNQAEAAYYLGLSHGVLGIYHVINSSYLKGYIHGRRGKNLLEETIKIDSTYYDAYLGLGLFHYYVDLLPGVIKFFAGLLGFHGDREQGIKEILITARQGRYFNVEGDFSYAVIRYFLEGIYSSSLTTFERLYKLYPENPALSLLIGYHYRRFGRIEQAEKYFNSVSESFIEKLPQIIVMKYYNLGVCYYRLNNFAEAEKYFDRLLDTSLRKSQYYQAAIAFYKGMLSGISADQLLADHYFGMIRYNQETQYWYYISRFYARYPFDQFMRDYLVAENNVYSFNSVKAARDIDTLIKGVKKNKRSLLNPDLIFLIKDLEARLAFRQGHVLKSRQLFESFINDLKDFHDDFQRAWILIGYARVLRESREWQAASTALEQARATDDEYTRLIIEREKYILKNEQAKLKPKETS